VVPRSARCPAALLLAFGLGTGAAAQEHDSSLACQNEVLRGRVSDGENYEAVLTPALVFRLDAETHPQNPPGWVIRVTPPSAPDSDYSMVATPPYRFVNPRYVDTSYGVTPEAALAMTPRRFAFVASPEDYDAAAEALGILLWPGGHASEEVEAARVTLAGLPKYPGVFFIEDGNAIPPDSDHPYGRIEWMAFRVELCLPPG
jgi:hypothetical protein